MKTLRIIEKVGDLLILYSMYSRTFYRLNDDIIEHISCAFVY